MEATNINANKVYKKDQKVMVAGVHLGNKIGIVKDSKKYLFRRKYLVEFTGVLSLFKPLWIPEDRILFRVCK